MAKRNTFREDEELEEQINRMTSQASCAVMRGDIDQPITARDHRSMTTARYSQPSSVRKIEEGV